jgi:nicotinate-nucleotide pyrophosphorylase (carboxylating)
MLQPFEAEQIDAIIRNALVEDIGDGDVTTLSTVPASASLAGALLVKADGVVAGLAVFRHVFALIDERIAVELSAADGAPVRRGQVIGVVRGPGQAILMGERLALNILQRMSGIASETRRYVDAVAGTQAVILDTRKTAPGLRVLDKMAVRLGGGRNHRFGLYDMALIKDNHIAAVGSIGEAVFRVRLGDTRGRPIEVEVANLDQLREALDLEVDRILLDNMTLEQMRQAVELAAGRVPLEASGGVSLETVASIAATGVDYISVGALTHSVKALDVSLEVTSET